MALVTQFTQDDGKHEKKKGKSDIDGLINVHCVWEGEAHTVYLSVCSA